MRLERMKLPSILGILAGSGLGLLAWSQTWFTVTLVDGAAAGGATTLEVGGATASPAIAALALAGLALAGALAIAGPLIRIVLGLLAAVLGGCLVLAASLSSADPVTAVSGAVAEATGVAGGESTAALIASITATAWPVVAIAGGVLVVLAGVLVVATGRAWPTSRRYGGGARLAADGTRAAATSDRAVDDWDGLSRGDDPTVETSATGPVERPDSDADGANDPSDPTR
ncbi:Trp biosynthesis-associated membrane protein [Agromyces sp. NPDC056523]|uniref:Trp biosynthesis-associated membrane protein n=1 Tax=Agromyces sp. NPDC056523 TaxID=3345850 RepID=UPI00366B9920